MLLELHKWYITLLGVTFHKKIMSKVSLPAFSLPALPAFTEMFHKHFNLLITTKIPSQTAKSTLDFYMHSILYILLVILKS